MLGLNKGSPQDFQNVKSVGNPFLTDTQGHSYPRGNSYRYGIYIDGQGCPPWQNNRTTAPLDRSRQDDRQEYTQKYKIRIIHHRPV